MRLRTWVITNRIAAMGMKGASQLPAKIIYNQVTNEVYTPPFLFLLHPELFKGLAVNNPITY